MARRTQKQIAEKYKGNMSYFRQPHPWRRVRFWGIFLIFCAGIAAAIWYFDSGTREFYNPGPLTSTHANLTSDCQSCHGASDGELMLGKVVPLLTQWTQDIRAGKNPLLDRPAHFFAELDIEHNCRRCHADQAWHRPDWTALASISGHSQIALAGAGTCSDCHQEHTGPGPMSMGNTASCMACHSDQERMAAALTTVKMPDSRPLTVAVNHKLADGIIHFLPPEKIRNTPVVFQSFASGHPAFGYQEKSLRDPNTLHFNHKRHSQADIPLLGGKKLDCNSCHQQAGDGEFYAPITYKNNCQTCHALNFDPDFSEMVLPHGDPEMVRTYLRNLPYQYSELANRRGYRDPVANKNFVTGQLTKLKDRVKSGEDFEKQIFYTVNPYRSQNPSGERSYFAGCAYCHEVKPTASRGLPSITHPVAADRWLGHGRFTHQPHTHVACMECHDANKSSDTADIIMPARENCAECHRTANRKLTSTSTPLNPLDAVSQRQHGGVGADCAVCHSFHPDANTLKLARSIPALRELINQKMPAPK